MVNFDRGMQIPAQVSQPDLTPENMTVSDYSGEFDAKIAQLEQQIAQVKERIARNKRALTGKSYEDVNNQIAALEMRKINSQDPSMLWRWQQQRQDTLKANANVKSKAAEQFANTVDMWKNTRLPDGTAAREQMISNLNAAIRDGRNAGADVSELLALKAAWEKKTYGNDATGSVNYGVGSETEQLAGLLKTALDTAKTSDELEQFKKDHPDLKAEQLSSVDTKINELKKKEKAKADEQAFVTWVEQQSGKKYSTLTKRMQDTYRRIYKNRGK